MNYIPDKYGQTGPQYENQKLVRTIDKIPLSSRDCSSSRDCDVRALTSQSRVCDVIDLRATVSLNESTMSHLVSSLGSRDHKGHQGQGSHLGVEHFVKPYNNSSVDDGAAGSLRGNAFLPPEPPPRFGVQVQQLRSMPLHVSPMHVMHSRPLLSPNRFVTSGLAYSDTSTSLPRRQLEVPNISRHQLQVLGLLGKLI